MAYLPLSTANLPDPAIDPAQGSSPEDYFGTLLFTATAGVAGSVNGLGFAPDFSWTKARNAAQSHQLFDNVRGDGVRLITNSTGAESDLGATYVSLEDDGIDYGSSTFTSNTYVAWNWKANGSGSTIATGSIDGTNPTIASQVSANTESGFSIVGYTGNGTAGATIGHGLSDTPEMIIVKNRDAGEGWVVYTEATGNTGFLNLNGTSAFTTSSGEWNNTSPTSSVFTVGTQGRVNSNTLDYIAYCFHSVEGFSKFGSYTGNGNADGPFVYTGFRPAFVMVKQATVSSRDWIILDDTRNEYNVADLQLLPNTSEAESTTFFSSTAYLDFLSNGFKIRNSSVRNNENTATYIYMAFAENPFKYSNAR